MPLFVYTRHASNSPGKHDRFWRRCHCPKWIRGFLNGKTIRTTARTRGWEAAEQKRNRIELNATAPAAITEARTLALKDALSAFVSDSQDRNLATATVAKLKTLKRQFEAFADEQAISLLSEVRVARLRAFRSTWKGGAIARKGKQERLSSFFNFSIRNEWLQENPVKKLTRILVQNGPTDYFPRQEFERIIQASYEYKPKAWKESRFQAERLRTLTLLMRWSGLRIGDAVTLERSRLIGDNVLLYTQKTGTPVFVPLPPEVAEMLRHVPPGLNPNPRYVFWSGHGTKKSVVSNWQKRYQALFKHAAITRGDGTPKRCYPHMFRDTFAVELLLSGVPLEQVSILLGHKSVKITEKHYAPWVRARQELLEQSVRRSWQIVVPITRTKIHNVDSRNRHLKLGRETYSGSEHSIALRPRCSSRGRIFRSQRSSIFVQLQHLLGDIQRRAVL